MEYYRILVADGSDTIRQELREQLQGMCMVKTCANGGETLELLRTFCPDLLVLDLMIPGKDGISLLQTARTTGIETKVLAHTRFCSDYVLEAAQRLGVCYMMTKPCDIQALVCRVEDLLCDMRRETPVQPDIQTQVTTMLLALGIPSKLSGYAQLREAVILMSQRPCQAITKELYPAVGALFDSSGEQVERTMRTAIKTAWLRGDPKVWQMYFGELKRWPTNAAFICRLSDCLNLSRRQELA